MGRKSRQKWAERGLRFLKLKKHGEKKSVFNGYAATYKSQFKESKIDRAISASTLPAPENKSVLQRAVRTVRGIF